MEQTASFVESIQKNMALIAAQAGVIIEHLWKIMTKQQFLYGLQGFVKGLIAVLFGIAIGRWMDVLKKSKMAALDKKTVLALGFVVIVVLMFWGASTMVDALPRLFNPEYYSIKDAVEMLQKVK